MRRFVASLGLVVALACPALADDPPVPPAPGTPGKAEVPEVHKIYIPFKDLQKVFEKEGQGVFLPYAEFRALWDRAYRMPDDPERPPVRFAVRSAEYAGVAMGESIRFTAKIEVEVLAPGWQRIPLDFGGVGIETATIAGEPALLVPTEKGYDLLLQGVGRRTLDLAFRAGAPAQADTHVAEISLPPVPLARLSLRVPGTDTDVQVSPRLAGSTGATPDGATELLAFLGPVSKVKLSWRRRPDEGPKVDPLVFAVESTDVQVDRGVVRTDFVATLSILRAPLETLVLVVPADAVVLYVEGQGLRVWDRNPAGDRIQVTLREPVKDAWVLKVGLERALKSLPAEVPLPLVGVEGLERETGYLRLRGAEGVKVDPRATPGLVQVDLSELPDPLKGAVAGKAFGWRHPARPGQVTANVEALASRVSAAVGNRVGLKPEGVELSAVAVVTVERAGIFGVAFDLPAALEVTDVRVQGAELDDWTRVPGEAGAFVLRVAFRDRLLGTATVWVSGRMPLALPDEPGKETAVEMPLVRLRDAQHVRGFVGVHADPALDRRETAREGLTALEAGAPSAVEPPQVADGTLPLAARFEHRDAPPKLAYAVKRKAATVTGEVETALRLEPDRTRVLRIQLRWLVQFRGVDTFRFRGPLDLAARVHLSPGLAGMTLLDPEPEARPEKAPEGWTATRGTWTLRLSAPRQGVVEVPLIVDDRPEEPLAAGGRRSVKVPVFVPVEPDGKPLANTKHHVSVQRDPLLEVAADKVEKGEEIDARELPRSMASAETFLAFRSYDPEHAISLTVVKHEFEPVAEVVISHMHLNTVVPAEGRGQTEAYLVVHNNDRQSLELRLPAGANIRAVQVDGKSVTPRRGDDGMVRIQLLSGLAKDQAFLVALVYDHEVDRSGAMFETVRLASPIPQRVKSDLLTWNVYVPREREVTAFGGDLERAEDGDSWALNLLQDLTGRLKRAPAGKGILPASVVSPYRESKFQLKLDGQGHLFTNRTGTGEVTFTSVSPTAFLLLRLALLIVAFLGARVLVRVARGLGYGPMAAFLVPALVLLLLVVPAGPGLAAVWTAMLVGVLLSGALSFLGWFARSRREAAAAAPPPAAPPAPASATGGGA
jgi:hypothetical protein